MSDHQEAMEEEEYTIAKDDKYDVFIVFCEEDKAVAQDVCDGLENHATRPVRCLASWKDGAFTPGKPVFDNIKSCMDRSKRTLLILTKNSIAPPTQDETGYRGWVTLETMLAIEKSNEMNSLILRILLCDLQIQHKDLEFLKKGILENIPHAYIEMSFAGNSWEDHVIDRLMEDVSLPDILPVGCLAHGQVFSHFVGFLSYVLPALETEIKNTDTYKDNPDQVSTKYYILLPASSEVLPTLECTDPDKNIVIEKHHTLCSTVQHAGKPRQIRLTMYRVQRGSEAYYFVADFPTVLNAIHKMQSLGLAEVDIRHQIARFFYTMNEVINHTKNEACNDTVRILPYNESAESLADVLFCAAKKDVIKGEAHDNMTVGRTPQRLMSQADLFKMKYDAIIVHDENDKDNEIAHKISTVMTANQKTVASMYGKAFLRHLEEARWIIFILSKESLQNNLIMRQCSCVLASSFQENLLRVLPVLNDITPEEAPQTIKWVTLLSITEPNYCLKILQIMNGEPIRMEHRLPAGDVATGLAWAYVINYLDVTLFDLDFRERIEKFLRENGITCGCVEKLYVIVPKTCRMFPNVQDEANEKLPQDKIPLKYLGKLDPVIKNTGGQMGRTYFLHMYQYTCSTSGKATCFITEYCTPVNCLHEMATNYPFAGLQLEDMYKQSASFISKLTSIVGRIAVKDKLHDISGLLEIINYDDEKKSLMEAFDEMKFDDIPDRSLVFAGEAEPQTDP